MKLLSRALVTREQAIRATILAIFILLFKGILVWLLVSYLYIDIVVIGPNQYQFNVNNLLFIVIVIDLFMVFVLGLIPRQKIKQEAEGFTMDLNIIELIFAIAFIVVIVNQSTTAILDTIRVLIFIGAILYTAIIVIGILFLIVMVRSLTSLKARKSYIVLTS